MHYVYILRSQKDPTRTYVGCSTDLKRRLREHNRGHTRHTASLAPWEIVTYICFTEQTKAQDFEEYLKTSSGKAFLNKRLLPSS